MKRIYTCSGDEGDTGLVDGTRITKADLRIAAEGDLDELISVLGWARAACDDRETSSLIETIQSHLFELGSGKTLDPGPLEVEIDRYARQMPPITGFVIPSGPESSARLHIARTVCRRAERAFVRANLRHALPFLNRLSDLLFILACRKRD